jgi:hypothetical protein
VLTSVLDLAGGAGRDGQFAAPARPRSRRQEVHVRQACHWRSEQQVLAAAQVTNSMRNRWLTRAISTLRTIPDRPFCRKDQCFFIEGCDNGFMALTGLFTGV